MFIERLIDEDYKEMFAYIFKNGFKFCDLVFDDNYTFADEIARKYGLKYDDGKMYICHTLKTANSARGKVISLSGKVVYMGVFHFYESYNGKNAYYLKDFEIIYDDEQDSINDICMIKDLNKAYLSYMYTKFGEEYKSAYLAFRNKQKEDVIKEHDETTSKMLDEMCKY